MPALKNLGHAVIVALLLIGGWVVGGHVSSLVPVLNMTVGGALSLLLSWGYIHFGVNPPPTV